MKLHLRPKILRLMGCIIPNIAIYTDDGGGMDPDSMRRCMSFGFSDKQSGSSIGQCLCFQLSFLTCQLSPKNSHVCQHFAFCHTD
jgi:hypothetical protein